MRKKGQLTLVIILGILMLFVIGIILAIQSTSEKDLFEDIKRQAQGDPQKLEVYIQACLDTITDPILYDVAASGGLINITDKHKRYYLNEIYPYHCSYTEGVGCQSNLYTRKFVEDQIEKSIVKNISSCIDLSIFEELGFSVTEGDMQIEATIGIDDVLVNFYYPVELKKDDMHITFDSVNREFFSELGYMLDLSNDIINQQVEHGYFDRATFMKRNRDTVIEIHKPYPDIIYKLQRLNPKTTEKIVFRFAIEGYDTAENRDVPSMNPPEEIIGYCKTPDGNCYINPRDIDGCTEARGTFETVKPECRNPSDPFNTLEPSDLCDGEPCESCGIYDHGDSWCEYDGVVGGGWDYIGTRHYQKVCFDGVVYTEECRDYREEICVEDLNEKHALCRVNRFDDCTFQTIEEDCTDMSKRDCVWQSALRDEDIASYGVLNEDHLCHPQVPPGIKHWTESGSKICDMGSEIRTCDGFECPTSWTDMTSLKCSFQGDCGIGRNRLDRLSMEGYMNPNMVNEEPREGFGYVDIGFTDGPRRTYEGRYHLELPLFVDDPIDKTNLFYENPDNNLKAYKQEVDKFVKEAQKWKLPCDFCDCIFGIPIGNCVYDKQTPFGAFCDVWQSPIGEMRCDFCNMNSDRPCSEYLCYSLGASCQFIDSDGDGVGICEAPDPNDNTGPKISLKSLNSNFSYEPYYDPFTGFEGIHVCRGEKCTGDINEDGLEPYSELVFEVSFSEDAKCKTSYTSYFEYYNIPQALPISWSSSSFSENLTIKTVARPISNINEVLAMFTGFTSVLSLTEIDDLENLVTMQYMLMRDKAVNYGVDAEDIDKAYQQFLNKTEMIREKVMMYKIYIDAALLSLSTNTLQVYIKCIDRAGNIQKNDFFVEYLVKVDTEQPVLLSNTTIDVDDYPYNLSLFFNEPIECKWSETDADFTTMPNRMDCFSNVFFAGNTGFECKEVFAEAPPSKKIFLRCQDQPKKKRDYYMKIERSDVFELKEDYPHIDLGGTNFIKVTDLRFLQDAEENVIYADTGDVKVELNYHADNECRFVTSDIPITEDHYYDDIPSACECGGKVCKCELSLSSDTTYINYVCRVRRVNPRNEDSFVIYLEKRI
jgi:hypothetical protein